MLSLFLSLTHWRSQDRARVTLLVIAVIASISDYERGKVLLYITIGHNFFFIFNFEVQLLCKHMSPIYLFMHLHTLLPDRLF